MTPSPPRPSNPVPDDPPAGREPLHEAIATARDERRGGISIGTLAVAAVASAVASFTVSHLWGAGTVISAALTPVLVALAKEFLQRPVDHVAATAQRVAPVRRRQDGADPAPSPQEPLPAAPPADWAPVSYHEQPRAGWHPRWRLVIVTGLLAFAIVVGVITVPELLVGHSITGAGGSLTFSPGAGSTPPAPKATTPPTTTTAAPQSTTTTPTTPTTTTTAPQSTTPTTDTTQTSPTAPGTTPTTPGTTTTAPGPATTQTSPGAAPGH